MIAFLRFLRIIIFVVLFYLLFKNLYKIFWKHKKSNFFTNKKNKPPQIKEELMKKDPICGTYIPESQAIKYKHENEVLFFCSESCKEKFLKLEKNR